MFGNGVVPEDLNTNNAPGYNQRLSILVIDCLWYNYLQRFKPCSL